MKRGAAAERLRRHLYAAADILVDLVARDAETAPVGNDDARPRTAAPSVILDVSDTDRAFAEKALRANGWLRGRRG